MIEPVTSAVAPATGTPPFTTGPELPLAARYHSADPISWRGSTVYPMYTEQLSGSAATLTMTLLSATPPPGVCGLGMGLSMVDGHIGVDRRRLRGVDVWRDALERGITVELSAEGRGALYSLTPVWRDADGAACSWSGNYGVVVERAAHGRVVLWCSLGAGPPHFADLVVEVVAAPADTAPIPAVGDTAPTPEAARPAPPYPGEQQRDPVAGLADHSPAPTGHTDPASTLATTSADPDYRGALYDLGVAMFRRGEEAQACELWSQAAAAGHPAAAFDLGVVRFRHGDLDAAEQWWQTAAQRRDVRAMIGLAELMARRGAHAQAQVWHTRAVTAKTVAQSLAYRVG
ncbi:tetratricopeptide repeat protein [Nocardia sp. NPDC059180]|uniref:tetratricopeptide repeat protein n=1 Tax=Nocardia sp. NPDC059180 TaxID=3346761 RepID=UPI0036CA4D00